MKKVKVAHTLHRPKRVLKCEFCTFTTQSKPYKLKQHHLRLHSEDKPYICDICHCKFRTNSEILGHKRRNHSHEKRFCCNVCGKSFVENGELTRHSLTHKEERLKSIKCDICDYCTHSISILNFHRKIHYPAEKTLDCNNCGNGFRNKPRLKRH